MTRFVLLFFCFVFFFASLAQGLPAPTADRAAEAAAKCDEALESSEVFERNINSYFENSDENALHVHTQTANNVLQIAVEVNPGKRYAGLKYFLHFLLKNGLAFPKGINVLALDLDSEHFAISSHSEFRKSISRVRFKSKFDDRPKKNRLKLARLTYDRTTVFVSSPESFSNWDPTRKLPIGKKLTAVTSRSSFEPLPLELEIGIKLPRGLKQQYVEFLVDEFNEETMALLELAAVAFSERLEDWRIVVQVAEKRLGEENLEGRCGFKSIYGPKVIKKAVRKVITVKPQELLSNLLFRRMGTSDNTRPYIDVMSAQHVYDVHWKSEIVIGGKKLDRSLLQSSERVRQVIGAVFDNPALQQEVREKMFDKMGGVNSAKIWERYLIAYDKLSFSDEYLRVGFLADDALPVSGIIADLAGGTGNMSVFLKYRSKKRNVFVVDSSKIACRFAREKISFLNSKLRTSQLNEFTIDQVVTEDLNNLDRVLPQMIEGAVLKSVFFLLSEELREKTLRVIRDRLPPDGTLFVMDPIASHEVIHDPIGAAKARHQKTADQTILNGAPLTEMDLAFVVAYQLMVKRPKPLKRNELLVRIIQAGFRIERVQEVYDGQALAITATKPGH